MEILQIYTTVTNYNLIPDTFSIWSITKFKMVTNSSKCSSAVKKDELDIAYSANEDMMVDKNTTVFSICMFSRWDILISYNSLLVSYSLTLIFDSTAEPEINPFCQKNRSSQETKSGLLTLKVTCFTYVITVSC